MFAGEKQLPDLWQELHRAFVLVLMRLAGPKRVFVELEPLAVHAAEHHRAQPPVANRQRLDPLRGRTAIPQAKRRGRRWRLSEKNTGELSPETAAGHLQGECSRDGSDLLAWLRAELPFTDHASERPGIGHRGAFRDFVCAQRASIHRRAQDSAEEAVAPPRGRSRRAAARC